jgi:hypothetical protein
MSAAWAAGVPTAGTTAELQAKAGRSLVHDQRDQRELDIVVLFLIAGKVGMTQM